MHTPIGFIGQGWIGKHYADDFAARGYDVVRYALEEPYVQNKSAIAACQIVFIAVPTPTDQNGFHYTAVTDALAILAPGTTAVIKSTLLPGTTEALQGAFPDLFVLHSPEFLMEATAAHDAAHPQRNLIGIPHDTAPFKERAQAVLQTLPTAPYAAIMTAREAELVKYAGNCFLYTKVVFMNMLHDIASLAGADFEQVHSALIADPRIGESHTMVAHRSGHDQDTEHPVRGAGGHCFIKDYEALRQYVAKQSGASELLAALTAYQTYNNQLLRTSEKDLDLLAVVHGA